MAKQPRFKINGIEETQELLGVIAPKKAIALNRSVNLAISAQIGKKIKELVPRDDDVLYQSIKWRRKRSPPERPTSIVFAGVSKKNGQIPFYWRFLEHGRGGENPQPGINFVSRAAEIIRTNIDSIYIEQFGKKLEALIKREKKKLAKK